MDAGCATSERVSRVAWRSLEVGCGLRNRSHGRPNRPKVASVTAFYDDEAALARIQNDIAAAQERAVRAQEVKARIDTVRGVGRSPRGEVLVEVDASGMLRDVTFTDAAMVLRPDDLAGFVKDAARAAQRDAGSRAVALTQDVFGEGSALTERLRAEVEQRYV